MVNASADRRAHFKAPAHVRRVIMSSRLSKDLRAEHGAKTMPLVQNDTVQVISGEFKGTVGKVTDVVRMSYQVFVEGVEKDRSGKKKQVPVNSSNLVITALNLEHESRKAILARRSKK